MTDTIELIRRTFNPTLVNLPEWLVFTLPNGLWIFSYALLITTIWDETRDRIWLYVWLYSMLMISVFSEIGQATHVIGGTFDPIDAGMYILGAALGFLLGNFLNRWGHNDV